MRWEHIYHTTPDESIMCPIRQDPKGLYSWLPCHPSACALFCVDKVAVEKETIYGHCGMIATTGLNDTGIEVKGDINA